MEHTLLNSWFNTKPAANLMPYLNRSSVILVHMLTQICFSGTLLKDKIFTKLFYQQNWTLAHNL